MESPPDEAIQEEVNILWQAALAGYNHDTKTSSSPAKLEALRNIKTPEDLAAQIEAMGASFSNFRSKHRQLWSTLKTLITPISIVAQIAITPTSVLDYGVASSAVSGAVVHLLKSGEGVSSAYDWIEQLFQELLEFTDRLTIYTGTRIDVPLQKKIVKILAAILSE
jgi:phage-related protein